jgi:hypothetical protein
LDEEKLGPLNDGFRFYREGIGVTLLTVPEVPLGEAG